MAHGKWHELLHFCQVHPIVAPLVPHKVHVSDLERLYSWEREAMKYTRRKAIYAVWENHVPYECRVFRVGKYAGHSVCVNAMKYSTFGVYVTSGL